MVEARLCGEDSCQDNSWWRIGSVQVNASTVPGLSVTLPVNSANTGDVVTATASLVSPLDDVSVPVIEWDSANDGTYETLHQVKPTLVAGDLVSGGISGGQLQNQVDTSTFGTRTIRARIYDSGAFDAADDTRRTSTATDSLYVNARPVASNGSRTISEDSGPGTFSLSASDADNQPLPLSYNVVSGPSKGSLSCTSGGSCTYTPGLNQTGTDSFTFNATDGPSSSAFAKSNTATYTITINAVNDPPVADDFSVVTNEDTAASFSLNGTDVEGPVTFAIQTGPTRGSLSCTGANCTYTPNANLNGPDSFVYRVTDNQGATDTATVSIDVVAVNDAPTAANTSLTTTEDTPRHFTVPAADVDNTTLTLTATNGTKGTVNCPATWSAGTTCTYTPAANYTGSDSFTYTVKDASNASATGTVAVTITAVNDPPVADDFSVVTNEDTAASFSLNGADAEGPVTFAIQTGPTRGSLSCTGANCTYTPNANLNGPDSFVYRVTDNQGATDTATVTIDVVAVNDAPVADDTAITTDEDTAVTFTPPASDVEDEFLTLTATNGGHGTVTCGVSTCTYTPNANHNPSDSFTYTATDDDGATDSGTVSVTINPVNDAPVADDTTLTTNEDTPAAVSIPATDVDGDSLTATPSAAAHGVVGCVSTTCSYFPASNYFGPDAFTVTVTDGHGGSDTATVFITVNSVNDKPVADDTSITLDEDTAVTFAPPATDVEDASLTLTATNGAKGAVTCGGALCTYTPDANANGSDTFTYTATDDDGASDSGTVSVTINPVNDAPVAHDASLTTDEDTAGTVEIHASDEEGDSLSYTPTDGAHGTVACDGSACTYSPAENFFGTDTFTVTVGDGTGAATWRPCR